MELRDDITIYKRRVGIPLLFLSLSPNRRIRDAQPKRQKKKEKRIPLDPCVCNISCRPPPPLRSAEHPTLHVSMHSSLGNKVLPRREYITNKVREKRRLCATRQQPSYVHIFPLCGFFFLFSRSLLSFHLRRKNR